MQEEAVRALRDRTVQIIEQGWCQDAQARDHRGQSVPPGGLFAVAWCLTGAIERAVGELRGQYVPSVFDSGPQATGELSILWTLANDYHTPTLFNDRLGRTQQEVIDSLRRIGAADAKDQ